MIIVSLATWRSSQQDPWFSVPASQQVWHFSTNDYIIQSTFKCLLIPVF